MIKTKLIQKTTGIKKDSDRHLPKVIKWKGHNMVRQHSFLSTVREIIDYSREIDLVRVGLIGDQHSGKTTLAMSIAHAIHKNGEKDGEIKYTVRVFNKHNLLNFEETIKSLTPANYVLVFDDVSFLGANANKKQIEMIKQAITEIRHLEGGHDVKIITILNYHYTLGLDKYLRQADFRYFTTIGSSEMDNMLKLVGTKHHGLINRFIQIRRAGVVTKHFSMNIGPKEIFTYKYRNPFIPSLFWNTDSLRLVVSPTRYFMDPVCSHCNEAEGENSERFKNIDELCTNGEKSFAKGNFVTAVKLLMHINGLTTFNKNVVRAVRYIDLARAQKVISLEDLANYYDLTVTKTRLRKKPDLK